jgi:hypothetical protein
MMGDVVSFLRHAGQLHIVCVVSLSNRKVDLSNALPTGDALPFAGLVFDGGIAKLSEGKLTMALDGFGNFVGKRR